MGCPGIVCVVDLHQANIPGMEQGEFSIECNRGLYELWLVLSK